jgi:hypothetical protein
VHEIAEEPLALGVLHRLDAPLPQRLLDPGFGEQFA